MAREALSNGDKILSENYLQHADHFMRILNERESNRKEKFLETRSEKNSDVSDQNAENSDQNSLKDTANTASDEAENQTSENQIEIN